MNSVLVQLICVSKRYTKVVYFTKKFMPGLIKPQLNRHILNPAGTM